MVLHPQHPAGAAPAADRPFTDREDCLAAFDRALDAFDPAAPFALVFHGVGGIGKTALRKHLAAGLADRADEVGVCSAGVCSAAVDFWPQANRRPEKALALARHGLRRKHGFRFPSFDIAYAVFWELDNPQVALTKKTLPFLEEGDLLIDVITAAEDVPGLGLLTKIPRAIHRLGGAAKTYWTKRGRDDLQALAGLEAGEILDRLPMFWASDLKAQLAVTGERVVLFLDTYEALWEGKRLDHFRFTQDAWIREWVLHLPEALWVITGRDALEWPKLDDAWDAVLEQHFVGALPEPDARRLLRAAGVQDAAVEDALIEGARGVPFYLDLALDTHEQIVKNEGRAPVPGDFSRTQREVVDRFLRWLDRAEAETVKVLSVARVWDRALFEDLVRHFGTNYPLTALADLCRFSFVEPVTVEGEEATGSWALHALMRDGVQEHGDADLIRSVHAYLFERYRAVLAAVDPRAVTETQQRALAEAFYHGQYVLERQDFIAWYRQADDAFQQAAQWRLLIPLQEALAGFVEAEFGAAHVETGYALHNLGDLYYQQARYAEAEPLYQRALGIVEKLLGSEHLHVAAALNNLALLFESQGRYTEAEPLYRRALGIVEQSLGSEHPHVATTLNNMAGLFRAQGRYAEAEPLYRRDLKISEHALGHDHPDVGTTLNNLAGLYELQGRFAEAEPLYRRSLGIRESKLGSEHPHVAAALNNLAGLYKSQGRYAEAEPLYRRSLGIVERSLGSEHAHVATTLNNLAVLYELQGRYAEAEPLYRRSLGIRESKLGSEHAHVATTLNNLAALYRAQGRYEEAELLYQRALGIYERALGQDHPSVATTLNNLAGLYKSQGRYAEAEPLYQRALGIYERALGQDHPSMATTLNNLAELYRAQGRYEEAEPLYQRALGIRESKLGREHPHVATTLNNLAGLYESQGRYAEAEPLYQRALGIRESKLGADHPDVGQSLNNLAELYRAQGRYEEAEPLYQRSLGIYERALGPEHPHVAATLNNLAGLYESQGRYEEAEPLYQRALGICEERLGADHPNTRTVRGNYERFLRERGGGEG